MSDWIDSIEKMKIELSDENVKLIIKALNYVVLSLDGEAIDNFEIDDKEKLNIMGQCYYIMQAINHAANDKEETGDPNKNTVVSYTGIIN